MKSIRYFGVFDSPYCLLIYLLKYTNQLDNTYFFISDGIHQKISKNLPHRFYIKGNGDLKSKPYFLRKLGELQSIWDLNRKLSKAVRPYKKKTIKVFGQDHIPGGNYFVANYPFILLEDGLANYTEVKEWNNVKFFYRWLYRLLDIRPIFGLDENVKEIYLTGLTDIPGCIKDKVKVINLRELWESKTLQEKEKILSIYNYNFKKIEKIKGYKYLLLTQPLSEDGILSELEKIQLYRSVVSSLNESDILIKIHPREKTNYQKYFPNSHVLVDPFPVELLSFNDIQFEKVITLFSTAANDYLGKDTQLEFVGTECHPALVNQFGIIRYNKLINKIEKIG